MGSVRWNDADDHAEVRVSSPRALAALAEAGLEPAWREEDGAGVFVVPKGAVRLKIGGVLLQPAGGQDGLEAFLREGGWGGGRPACALEDGIPGRLTPCERETFITWGSAGPAEVETASRQLRQRLEKAGVEPVRKDSWWHVYQVPREAVRLKLRTSVRLAG